MPPGAAPSHPERPRRPRPGAAAPRRGRPTRAPGRHLLPRLAADRRGVTLLEVLLAVAVMGLLLGPALYLFTQGTRTEADTRRQFAHQERAYRVLTEIADGRDEIPGLRAAAAVSVNGGLSFRAGASSATYYLDGGRLYRKACTTPPCDPEDPVVPAGGTPVLEDMTAFQATRTGRLVTITLEVHTPAGGVGSSPTGVRLTTKVLLRNLP